MDTREEARSCRWCCSRSSRRWRSPCSAASDDRKTLTASLPAHRLALRGLRRPGARRPGRQGRDGEPAGDHRQGQDVLRRRGRGPRGRRGRDHRAVGRGRPLRPADPGLRRRARSSRTARCSTPTRPSIPLELDQIYSVIDDLTVALGPKGANSEGALTDLLDHHRRELRRPGRAVQQDHPRLRQVHRHAREQQGGALRLRRASSSASSARWPSNDKTVREFNKSLAGVADLLADEREELALSLKNLGTALGEVPTFVKDNKTPAEQEHQGPQPGLQVAGQAARRARRDPQGRAAGAEQPGPDLQPAGRHARHPRQHRQTCANRDHSDPAAVPVHRRRPGRPVAASSATSIKTICPARRPAPSARAARRRSTVDASLSWPGGGPMKRLQARRSCSSWSRLLLELLTGCDSRLRAAAARRRRRRRRPDDRCTWSSPTCSTWCRSRRSRSTTSPSARSPTSTLDGYTAVVTLQLRNDVDLPDNAVAEIRQTSLLGEKFVSLAPPADSPSPSSCGDGDRIALDRTGRNPEVEEVLGALSLLLNGGGVAQLKTIASELNKALDGRESNAKSVLTPAARRSSASSTRTRPTSSTRSSRSTGWPCRLNEQKPAPSTSALDELPERARRRWTASAPTWSRCSRRSAGSATSAPGDPGLQGRRPSTSLTPAAAGADRAGQLRRRLRQVVQRLPDLPVRRRGRRP